MYYYLWWKKSDMLFNPQPKRYTTILAAQKAKQMLEKQKGIRSIISLSGTDPIEINTDNGKKLKPCPFCKNEDLRGPDITEYQGDTYKPVMWIECLKCDVVMYHDGTDITEITDKWNRRS